MALVKEQIEPLTTVKSTDFYLMMIMGHIKLDISILHQKQSLLND